MLCAHNIQIVLVHLRAIVHLYAMKSHKRALAIIIKTVFPVPIWHHKIVAVGINIRQCRTALKCLTPQSNIMIDRQRLHGGAVPKRPLSNLGNPDSVHLFRYHNILFCPCIRNDTSAAFPVGAYHFICFFYRKSIFCPFFSGIRRQR